MAVILICSPLCRSNEDPEGGPQGMRAMRKQAMHGLSGASLRRHRSRRLAPLQEEALLW
jgi:hypothetical protein